MLTWVTVCKSTQHVLNQWKKRFQHLTVVFSGKKNKKNSSLFMQIILPQKHTSSSLTKDMSTVMRAFLCKHWYFQCTYTCYRPSRVLTFKINRLRFLSSEKPHNSTWMRSAPPGVSLSLNLWLWNERKAQFSTGWAVNFSWLCDRSLRSSLITNKLCQHILKSRAGSSYWGYTKLLQTHKWACTSKSD